MKLKKSVKDARRTWRRTVIVMSLVLVLLLALAGATFAGTPRPNSVIDVNLADAGRMAPAAPMGKSTIGDYVWWDADADGQQDGGELPIEDVVLELWIWNDVTDKFEPVLVGGAPYTATTDENGYYLFDATAEGNIYEVRVPASNWDMDGDPLYEFVHTSWDTFSHGSEYDGVASLVQMDAGLLDDFLDADFGFAKTSLTVTKDPPLTLLPGSTATFNIVVKNTGQVRLVNIDLVDNYSHTGSTVSCTPDPLFPVTTPPATTGLEPGASTNATCTVTNVQEDFVNTVTATATPIDKDGYPAGGDNTPSDVSNDAPVTLAAPQIDVEKYVSVDGGNAWIDADTIATQPELLTGTNPQFKFWVKNTGNVDLVNVDVTDDVLGTIHLDGTLTAGQVVEYFVTTELWAKGQHTNTATATGDYTDDGGHPITVDDDDAANYWGAEPAIDVEKYVSVDGGNAWIDADTIATQPELLTGTNPQFKFWVKNTGNVDLVNVDVTDDVLGTIHLDGTLTAGQVVEYFVTTELWAKGQHTNTATATGDYLDDGGHPITVDDDDAANYWGADPSYTIEKQVSVDGKAIGDLSKVWLDADDEGTAPLLLYNTKPAYRVIATNTGNVPLTLNITDPTLPELNKTGVVLPVVDPETPVVVSGPIEGTWAAGLKLNTATVAATYTDDGNHSWTDSQTDPAYYNGVASSIGDFVWWDVNWNGIQDTDEPGIPGVLVTIVVGGVTYTDDTDEDGYYSFENLPGGDYNVRVPGTNWDQSTDPLWGMTLSPTELTDSAVGSNGFLSSGNAVAPVTLPNNTSNDTVDFGFVKTTSYTLTKEAIDEFGNPLLDNEDEVRTDDTVRFKITVQNTGQTYITTMPLVDTYDSDYLTYLSADPPSDDDPVVDDEIINWSNIAPASGIAPGGSVPVIVTFKAKADTTGLNPPNTNPYYGQTVNTATAPQLGTFVDPDGPNYGIDPAPSPVPDQTDDDGIQIIFPTGVALASAGVTVTADGALVAWETADESAILGFNVLRDGVAVNAEFILASLPGVNAGAGYSFLDAAASGASGHVLEVIGLDGSVLRVELGD